MRRMYVDESGRWGPGGTLFVGMGACSALDGVWNEFDKRWTAVLKKHNVRYMHMKEFTGPSGVFKGWTEDQRRALLADLLNCLDGLTIYMFASVIRCQDFDELPEDDRKGLVDPYLCTFQETLHGAGLLGYLDPAGTESRMIYGRQDEFAKRFAQLYEQWKAPSEDGVNLGTLEFLEMVGVPGLQLADMVAYENMHYWFMRQKKPENKARYPFRRLCDHQIALKAGMFKYVPGWQLKFKAAGTWSKKQEELWNDRDTNLPMLRELAPPEIMSDERIARMAYLRAKGAVEQLRNRELTDENPQL